MISNNALDLIVASFGDGCERVVAETLLAFIERYPKTKHVNIQTTQNLLRQKERKVDDACILKTLQFLSGERLQLLQPRFEYIEEDDPTDIDDETAANAIFNLINPITGVVDEDCAKKIFLYFQPTSKALNEH